MEILQLVLRSSNQIRLMPFNLSGCGRFHLVSMIVQMSLGNNNRNRRKQTH